MKESFTAVEVEAKEKKIEAIKGATIEVATNLAIHALIAALGLAEVWLFASGHIVAALVIASVAFVAAAIYDKTTKSERNGLAAISVAHLAGIVGNAVWYWSWPQDFEGFNTIAPIAFVFFVIGIMLQVVVLKEDLFD